MYVCIWFCRNCQQGTPFLIKGIFLETKTALHAGTGRGLGYNTRTYTNKHVRKYTRINTHTRRHMHRERERERERSTKNTQCWNAVILQTQEPAKKIHACTQPNKQTSRQTDRQTNQKAAPGTHRRNGNLTRDACCHALCAIECHILHSASLHCNCHRRLTPRHNFPARMRTDSWRGSVWRGKGCGHCLYAACTILKPRRLPLKREVGAARRSVCEVEPT